MTEQQEKNKPVGKYKNGAIELTVWENTGKKTDGNNYSFYSYNLVRNYKDSEDNWQKSTSFKTADLPRIVSLLQKAYENDTVKQE